MALLHSSVDVYVGDDHRFMAETTQVIDDRQRSRVRVRTKTQGRSSYADVLELSEVTREKAPTGQGWRWTGQTADGETLVLTALHRAKLCCGRR